MPDTPTTNDPHPAIERIRAYFAAYHHGTSLDYAAQWVYPASLFSGGCWSSVADAATMARHNDDYAQAQQAAGAVDGEILGLECTAIGPEAALVRGRFARLRADGSRLADTASSYLVVKVASDRAAPCWKVAVCVSGA